MNKWTKYSILYANQRSYLDDLFKVYPTIPEGIRDIDNTKWKNVEKAFKNKDNESLIASLLQMELFPIKDSYVAYLRKDQNAIKRNPQTINRLCGRIYELGLDKIFEKCSEPKETNRQIGPLFKEWVRSKALGITPVPLNKFTSTTKNAILDASDSQMLEFAKKRIKLSSHQGIRFLS